MFAYFVFCENVKYNYLLLDLHMIIDGRREDRMLVSMKQGFVIFS